MGPTTSHTNVANELWQADEAIIATIAQSGFETYLKSLPNFEQAFKLKDHSLRCMDEGTPGGIHVAGSGILLDLDKAKEFLVDAKLDGIYSHAECGAAALYAKQENLDPEFADEYGVEWAKTLAERLGVPYKGHIEIEKMNRPSGLHTAKFAYYDATGSFDYSAVPGLPAGFIINRKYLSSEYGQKELEIALSIAFGGHGFGSRFTPESPFRIIILANDSQESDGLLKEATETAKVYGNRVKVERVTI